MEAKELLENCYENKSPAWISKQFIGVAEVSRETYNLMTVALQGETLFTCTHTHDFTCGTCQTVTSSTSDKYGICVNLKPGNHNIISFLYSGPKNISS